MKEALKLKIDNTSRKERYGLRSLSITGGELKGETGFLHMFAPSQSYSKGESFIAAVELTDGKLIPIPIKNITLDSKRHGLRPLSITSGEFQGEEGFLHELAPSKSYSKGESFIALVELTDGKLIPVPIEDTTLM